MACEEKNKDRRKEVDYESQKQSKHLKRLRIIFTIMLVIKITIMVIVYIGTYNLVNTNSVFQKLLSHS